jgi:hypothetical protein
MDYYCGIEEVPGYHQNTPKPPEGGLNGIVIFKVPPGGFRGKKVRDYIKLTV